MIGLINLLLQFHYAQSLFRGKHRDLLIRQFQHLHDQLRFVWISSGQMIR